MKAVIIAAGQSSRLWQITDGTPKTLLPYKKGTILSTIIKNLKRAGANEIFIVVGYEREKIIQYIKEQKLKVKFVHNDEWQRGNGLSVLKAQKVVGKDLFILSMCDHIVSCKAVKRLVKSKKKQNLLLVDKRINEIFDLDDATKVKVDKDKILKIDKELDDYNGIDCGIFRLSCRYFNSMKKQLKITGQESISAAVRGLIAKNDMRAVFLKKDESWIDIDTPEAYEYALKGRL